MNDVGTVMQCSATIQTLSLSKKKKKSRGLSDPRSSGLNNVGGWIQEETMLMTNEWTACAVWMHCRTIHSLGWIEGAEDFIVPLRMAH